MKILNNNYKIKYVKDTSMLYDNTKCATCDYSEKEINIAKSSGGITYSDKWLEETLTHELAHAFMYETGNDDLNDERHAELLTHFAMFIKANVKEIKIND